MSTHAINTQFISMKLTIRLLICCALVLPLLAGCATPSRRAQQKPTAFHKLSPSDQKLVLNGKIRPGMDRDAVFIAWGPPDWKMQGGKGQEECESWIYYRELTTYQPTTSYDIPSPSAPFLEPRFTLGLHPMDAPGGLGADGFLYAPRIMITDVRLKRADFRWGYLHNYSIRRGSHYLTTEP
jgi:hypothetical protein